MKLPYEYRHLKSGKLKTILQDVENHPCPRGYERVFSSDIKRGPNGTVSGR